MQSLDNLFSLRLGTHQVQDEDVRIETAEDLLSTHLAIFGGTRYGKSKLFELLCRQLMNFGRGFAFIDPHSDTADDLLSYLSFRSHELPYVTNRVHYLKPDEQLFSFDPFVYHPDPDDPLANDDFHYRTWLNTKIKDLVKIIVRQQGETEDEAQKMVRLRRWLYNALYAVGVRQDKDGTHLPLSDAFVLLNPKHPRHENVYGRVASLLEDTVRSDFEKLRATRDARKQEDWVESTFNRLRDVLSPLVQRIFNLEAPSIDFRDIIQRNGIILASLGKTTRFHQDESLTIAGLLIREITEAVRTVERSKRNRFYLFMDEAQNFLGEDLLHLLKESAKYKLSVGLAVQALDNLKKGEMDLTPAVLGQCGMKITFRQQYHAHAETLAQSLCYPLLDFTELTQEVDRNDGYDYVWMPSTTMGEGVSQGQSESVSKSEQYGTAETDGVTNSTQDTTGYSEGRSYGENFGTQDSESESYGFSTGRSTADTWQDTTGTSDGESWQNSAGRTDGDSVQHTIDGSGAISSQSIGKNSSHSQSQSTGGNRSSSNSHSTGGSASHTESESHGRQRGSSRNKGHSTTNTQTTSHNHGEGHAVSRSTTTSSSVGTSKSQSRSQGTSQNRSISLALKAQARTRVEIQKTGKLVLSVQDQVAIQTNLLQRLEKQHCLIALAAHNSSFVIRIDDVVDLFNDQGIPDEWKQKKIDDFKKKIYGQHSHYFSSRQQSISATDVPSTDTGGKRELNEHFDIQ